MVSSLSFPRSSLCENYLEFSHGLVSFAFSTPQTEQNRKNREKFCPARQFAKFLRVFSRPGKRESSGPRRAVAGSGTLRAAWPSGSSRSSLCENYLEFSHGLV